MKSSKDGQVPIRLLIMYMISALLFLMSFDLHIHVHSDKVYTGQQSVLHVRSIADEHASDDSGDEINISPSGVLKLNQNSSGIIAVMLLITLIAVLYYFEYTLRLLDNRSLLPRLPFHGAPALRAPPVSIS